MNVRHQSTNIKKAQFNPNTFCKDECGIFSLKKNKQTYCTTIFRYYDLLQQLYICTKWVKRLPQKNYQLWYLTLHYSVRQKLLISLQEITVSSQIKH